MSYEPNPKLQSGTPAELDGSDPSLTDTVTIKRRERRVRNAEEQQRNLPKVPKSLLGRVICAHSEIVTAICALGMAATFLFPHEMLTFSTTVGVAGFAFGWADLLQLPSRRESRILITLTGISAIILGRVSGDFSVIAQVVGFGIIGAFVAEMLRRTRTDLFNSVAGNIAGVLIVSTAGSWVVLESQDLWYFLLVPGALTLLGGCLGMSLSSNWQPRWRAVASVVGAALFGFSAGAIIMGLGGSVREQMVVFAGGQLPSLAVALVSGAALGLIIGLTFAVLNLIFSAGLIPITVGGAISQGLIPVLASSVPIYILGRLVVGQGPTLTAPLS